ncbi:uncharacterized protein N7503_008677 [Penicillium pulvis]|uniref:uncharacterized protein n=1 Tax=Penicillium pulvis TaxID=1562058 RepID=UPI0025497BDE|nr:uncharacterized protein N7503_008677 [Penicillium pulvis]KAJ5792699.1 hypothetical protein N7503_008677 [Penicillium pulvis]
MEPAPIIHIQFNFRKFVQINTILRKFLSQISSFFDISSALKVLIEIYEPSPAPHSGCLMRKPRRIRCPGI